MYNMTTSIVLPDYSTETPDDRQVLSLNLDRY